MQKQRNIRWTQKDLDETLVHIREEQKAMLRALGIHIIKPLKDRIAKLEGQIDELRANGFKYAGVYQRAVRYTKGTVVTFDGSMFVAVKDTQPAQGPLTSDCWQLAVKSGRDAPRPATVVRIKS
jgi:hypothetical protein